MTATEVLVLSAIVSAFLTFGGFLAWGDFYSRNGRKEPPSPRQPALAETPAAIEHRKAA